MQQKVSRQIPPASPSRPSERLMALVTPMIASTVKGTANQSGNQHVVREQAPERVDLDPAEDDDQSRRQLPEQLPLGAQVPAVVGHAERDDDRRAGQVRPDEPVLGVVPQQDGDEDPDRHRDPAHPGDRQAVDLPAAGHVHHPQPHGERAKHRHQGDGEQDRQQQCGEEDQGRSFPGRNPARTGTRSRVNGCSRVSASGGRSVS